MVWKKLIGIEVVRISNGNPSYFCDRKSFNKIGKQTNCPPNSVYVADTLHFVAPYNYPAKNPQD